jgi:hypothetical protein
MNKQAEEDRKWLISLDAELRHEPRVLDSEEGRRISRLGYGTEMKLTDTLDHGLTPRHKIHPTIAELRAERKGERE